MRKYLIFLFKLLTLSCLFGFVALLTINTYNDFFKVQSYIDYFWLFAPLMLWLGLLVEVIKGIKK